MTFVPSLVTASKGGQNLCSNFGCSNKIKVEGLKPSMHELPKSTVETLREKGQIVKCSDCGADCVVCSDCAKKNKVTCFYCMFPEAAE